MKLNEAHARMVETISRGYPKINTPFPHPDDIDSVAEHCGALLDSVGTYLKAVIDDARDIGVTDIRDEVDAFFSDLKSEIRAAYSVASDRKREPAE